MLLSRRSSRRVFLAAGSAPLLAAFGCGTILYPERRGQPAGRLDWGVVALNTIGLLLFFIPGVIAFAVDFSNGTIYLPDESYGAVPTNEAESSGLRACRLECVHPSMALIEAAVQRETQITVNLQDEAVQSRPLNSLREFWGEVRSLRRV